MKKAINQNLQVWSGQPFFPFMNTCCIYGFLSPPFLSSKSERGTERRGIQIIGQDLIKVIPTNLLKCRQKRFMGFGHAIESMVWKIWLLLLETVCYFWAKECLHWRLAISVLMGTWSYKISLPLLHTNSATPLQISKHIFDKSPKESQ